QAEESYSSANGENVEVMNGNGDFAKRAVVSASDEKDVETFLQKILPLVEASGPEFQAKFLECKKACSDHLSFWAAFPILGRELIAPFFYRNSDQNLRFLFVCNCNWLQNLAGQR